MVALKICGVTRAEDLRVCAELGVDAVGFNLWPGSKRYLPVRELERVIAHAGLAEHGPARVGVFVDHDLAALAEAIAILDLDLIQPHGDGPVEPIAELASQFEIGWIWVLRGTPRLDRLVVPQLRPSWILLDAAVAGFGGAGQTTDWAWAAEAVVALAPTPVWLAGGIVPSNVLAAIHAVHPAGIDVASGSELVRTSNGSKDPAKIAALVRGCRGL